MRSSSQRLTRIKPNQVFLDGSDRYEPGQVYKVPLERARYFARNGWLEGTEFDTRVPEIDEDGTKLEIDKSWLGLRALFRKD